MKWLEIAYTFAYQGLSHVVASSLRTAQKFHLAFPRSL
jgi:hypothetical protein